MRTSIIYFLFLSLLAYSCQEKPANQESTIKKVIVTDSSSQSIDVNPSDPVFTQIKASSIVVPTSRFAFLMFAKLKDTVATGENYVGKLFMANAHLLNKSNPGEKAQVLMKIKHVNPQNPNEQWYPITVVNDTGYVQFKAFKSDVQQAYMLKKWQALGTVRYSGKDTTFYLSQEYIVK